MIDTQYMEQEPEIVTDTKIIVSTIHSYKGLSGETIILYNADRNLNRINEPTYIYDESSKQICFNKDEMTLNNYAIKEDNNFKELVAQRICENLEEELRLFYVGCTRAKEKLIIACENKQSKIKYIIENNPSYVSYIRWIIESKVL